MQISSLSSNSNLKYGLYLAVFSVLFFGVIGQTRLVDGDEGFYLLAAKLLMGGQQLYFDFFYPQMPLLPYLYSGWFTLSDVSWGNARWLNAGMAAGISLLIYRYGIRCSVDRRTSFVIALLFVTSSLAFTWFVVAKTYALTALLLTWSIVCFVEIYDRKGQNHSLGKVFASGLLLGLCIDSRLMMAGLLPVFIVAILLLKEDVGTKLRLILAFCSGGFLSLLPLAYFLYHDFQSFYFNNLGYHGLRSADGFVGAFSQKWKIARRLLWYNAQSVQNLSIVIFLVLFRRCVVSSKAYFLAAVLAGISAINLLPTPTFIQYFCINVPVLFLLIQEYAAAKPFYEMSKVTKKWLSVLLVTYLLMVPFEIFRITTSGKNVPGVSSPVEWRLSTILKISNWLSESVGVDDKVISFWPGFLVESDVAAWPKTENHFSWMVSDLVGQAEADHFNLMTLSGFRHLVQERRVTVVIVNLWTPRRDEVEGLLESSGYSVQLSVGDVDVYQVSQAR